MSQALLYGPRQAVEGGLLRDPALRYGLSGLEQALAFELDETGAELKTWASDDSISVFAKDLYHSYNLGSWSTVGDKDSAREADREGWGYLVGEHRPDVSVFMPDGPLDKLRTERKRGIRVEGREIGWFSALQFVAERLGPTKTDQP